jgi:hypothetical protein
MVTPAEAAVAARFLWGLPAFFRQPIRVDTARSILRARIERRECDFLTLARQAIYANRRSPYRQLLAIAGCDFGDLEKLVRHEGLEGALRRLFALGVYLTVDEYKGRQPVIRGSATFSVDSWLLHNPNLAVHTLGRTTGSLGSATWVPFSLANIRERAVNTLLAINAWGASEWRRAVWAVPGGSAMAHMLEFYAFGDRPSRWFSQIDPDSSELHPRYRWSARVLRLGAALARVPLARPRFVPSEDALTIARWMGDVLRAGGAPQLHTYPTAAVRVCGAATAAGIDLQGARFTTGGEPVTAARLAAIRRCGAEVLPHYGSAECGRIGEACLAPRAPDDLHLYHDFNALIQAEPDVVSRGVRPATLFVSSLRPTAQLILLNVSLGDQADVLERACGCPMEQLGWVTHVSNIRSFDKLTAAGMTFLDHDLIRVLEEVLPTRFGGAPTDYQLVEEELADGQPRLRLLVHPAVGPLDEGAVANEFLAAIGGGSGLHRIMELQWRQADVLTVERQVPRTTALGKILHLHHERRSTATSAAGR